MMDELEAIDLDSRPETYWPDGFRPVRPEKHPPPVAEMDPGGEVYWDANGNAHYVQYPDEVEIAVIGRTKKEPGYRLCAHRGDDDRIHYRYILDDPADSSSPAFFIPGILSSARPLMLGELVYAIDTTIIDDPDFPAEHGLLAWIWNVDEVLGSSTGARRSASQGKTATSAIYPELEPRCRAVRQVFIDDALFPLLTTLPPDAVGLTFPDDSMGAANAFLDTLTAAMRTRPPASTFDASPFDFDARPETYWPEGFTPFVADPDAPSAVAMDPGGEVYAGDDAWWHYVAFPDEVVIAEMGGAEPDFLCARRDGETIRYRWVMMQDAELQRTVDAEGRRIPPMITPGITESSQPLSFGELVWLLDQSIISNDGYAPDTRGLMAWQWAVDANLMATRTERMFEVNGAPTLRSDLYPQLTRYEQAVGGHYIQTGELFELEERPE